MHLFDTHSHLTDERFDGDRDALIASLPEKGVALVLDCACDLPSCHRVKALTDRYPFLYAAYGVHPHQASDLQESDYDTLKSLLKSEKCVALGEIGLDYHYDFSPREVQQKRFVEQLELAVALGKPVILHDREAHADMLSILKRFRGRIEGVMHCYSGSAEMVRDYLDIGLHFGFGGSVTFQNAAKTQAAAKVVPLNRLLIETDCPYLAPVPFRGQRNDPSLVRWPCEQLARLHGLEADVMADLTFDNGKRLFGIG